jgi:hypothetical protein
VGVFGQPRLLSTRSGTCKTRKVSLARKATHNYTNGEKLCLFKGKVLLEKNLIRILVYDDHKTILC